MSQSHIAVELHRILTSQHGPKVLVISGSESNATKLSLEICRLFSNVSHALGKDLNSTFMGYVYGEPEVLYISNLPQTIDGLQSLRYLMNTESIRAELQGKQPKLIKPPKVILSLLRSEEEQFLKLFPKVTIYNYRVKIMDARLEESLFYAGKAGDISSLKDLARSENRKSERLLKLLTSVLKRSGSVVVGVEETYGPVTDGFTMTEIGPGQWRIEHDPRG